MAQVRVIAYEPVAASLGSAGRRSVRFSREIAEHETVEDFVRRLTASHPALADITFSPSSEAMVPAYRIFVNGTRIPLAEWATTRLEDGDRVMFRRMY